MKPRDMSRWAKEQVLEFIDRGIQDYKEEFGVLDMDEHLAIYKERNRVARQFGLAEVDEFKQER